MPGSKSLGRIVLHAMKADRYEFLKDTQSSISESVPRPSFYVLGNVSKVEKERKEKYFSVMSGKFLNDDTK